MDLFGVVKVARSGVIEQEKRRNGAPCRSASPCYSSMLFIGRPPSGGRSLFARTRRSPPNRSPNQEPLQRGVRCEPAGHPLKGSIRAG